MTAGTYLVYRCTDHLRSELCSNHNTSRIQNNPQQRADTQSGFSVLEVSQQHGMLWLHSLVESMGFISVSDLIL